MQRQRVTHQTKSARARRDRLLRIGVWIFIVIFAFGSFAGLIVIGTQLVGR